MIDEEALRLSDDDPDLLIIGSCDGLFVIRREEVRDYVGGVGVVLLCAILIVAFVSATWLRAIAVGT